jgi:hypothetical protein
MPDTPDLIPAAPDDIQQTLAFALGFDGRKRFRRADDMMAVITARHLIEHLDRCGFVLMKRRDSGLGHTSDIGKAAQDGVKAP